jgi:TerC family integral membrane protein
MPMTESYEGAAFFVRQGARWVATPLLLVLVLVETTDVFLATDSITAVLGITRDPVIVYTSNILAVLGLRSLYFVLARALLKFRYLHFGICVLLVFVGSTMLGSRYFRVPTWVSLAVICAVVSMTVLLSLPRRDKELRSSGGR